MNDNTVEQENHFEIPAIINTEISIFLNRLTSIFERLMMKLEFAATISLIISDESILEVLKKEDLHRILTLFSQINSRKKELQTSNSKGTLRFVGTDTGSSYDSSYHSLSKSSCSHESAKDRTDVDDLLKILFSYPMMQQFSTSFKLNVPKLTTDFLRQLKYFMEFIISKTASTPIEEREKELYLRILCAQIEQSKLEISDLTVSLEEQKFKQRTEAQQLTNKLDNLLDEWQTINDEYNNNLTQLLKTSKDNKAKAFQEFTERINNHQFLFEKLKTQLENDKSNNKKIEHEIQKQKFKVESQLTSLIMKFDTEIGDRQETYDNLMQEYENLEKEKSQLMDEFDDQSIVYNSIIREREEKEFEEYRERYMNFVTKRSAKLIQRWWRNVQLKLKKKDKKKGKKKKAKA